MPSNLDLVRSIYAAWERGDFSSVEWADPGIELVIADGPEPGVWMGLAGLLEGTRGLLDTLADYRVEADDYRELDCERVLVLMRHGGRGKASGLAVGQLTTEGANVLHVRDGNVERLVLYWDRDRALADLGLAPEGGPS
jgi:ketosteroid isomerase-like protein